MDLEEIRWKTAEELVPEEAEFLRESKDKLNEEELEAFADVLKDPEEETEDVEDEEVVEEEEKEEEEKEEEEEKKDPQYLTKEDANSFVQKALEDREAAKKDSETGTKQEQAAKKEILKLFDDGYKATDANEFANKLIEVLTPVLTQKTVENLQQMTTDQRKRFDEANSKLDDEYKELATKNKLPDLTSEKGQVINAQLATVAAKYGMDNYHDAFDLWSKLPEKFGGGLTVEDQAAAKKKVELKGQKKAASMVGKGAGEGSGSKTKGAELTREDLATNDMDTLLERATS